MISVLSILPLLSLVFAQKCALQFDGRVPQSATLSSFDTSTSPFNPGYVLGASISHRHSIWNSLLKFNRFEMERGAAVSIRQHFTCKQRNFCVEAT